MKEHDKFIKIFKSVESLIKEVYSDNPNASFRWYEEQQSDVEYANKLRLCRNIRNFIQHNKDYEDFIKISPCMQEFLENVLLEIKIKKGVAWDITTSIGRCFFAFEDSFVYEIVEGMSKKKLNVCIVLDADGKLAGIFNTQSICKAITSGKQLKKMKLNNLDRLYTIPKNTTIAFVKKDTEKSTALNYYKNNYQFVLVTENGKQDGKILGIVKNLVR